MFGGLRYEGQVGTGTQDVCAVGKVRLESLALLFLEEGQKPGEA